MLWILALVIIGVVSAVGYYQGVVRVFFSLLGLICASLFAGMFSGPLQNLLRMMGVSWPILRQAAAPVAGFVLILILFKIIGFSVHRKLDFFYKYKKSDEERIGFEGLSARLGAALGVLNGAIYFFLLMILVYVAGYLTVQMASDENDSALLRFLNANRRQLHSSGLDRVVAGHDPAPRPFYEAADLIGLIRENPVLQRRLGQYPGLLSLAERAEFQALAGDKELTALISSKGSLPDLVKNSKVKAILKSEEISSRLGKIAREDLPDLREYLETGKSPKYADENILGRWDLDVDASILAFRRKYPGASVIDVNRYRQQLNAAASSVRLVATPENKLIFRRPGATVAGDWGKEGGKYTIVLNEKTGAATGEALMTGADRLTMFLPAGQVLVFNKET